MIRRYQNIHKRSYNVWSKLLCYNFIINYFGLNFIEYCIKMWTRQNILLETFSVSNSLDPDQDRLSNGPDLGPNCLQRLTVNDKSCR